MFAKWLAEMASNSESMLAALSKVDRWAAPGADVVKRKIAADAYEEDTGDSVGASALRDDTAHVMVVNGRVVRAMFAQYWISQIYGRLRRLLQPYGFELPMWWIRDVDDPGSPTPKKHPRGTLQFFSQWVPGGHVHSQTIQADQMGDAVAMMVMLAIDQHIDAVGGVADYPQEELRELLDEIRNAPYELEVTKRNLSNQEG